MSAGEASENHYTHKTLESKWRKKWLKDRIYCPDLIRAKKPFYNLMMFPYPSSEGLHVGNMYAFTGTDIYGRFKRLQGYNVFEPIGLDGFGIHSENFAIKIGKHPKKHAADSEKNFYRQLLEIGNGFDWEHRLETYDPDYYKWTQWLFIQMFKAGLAYKGEAPVNWCPSCKTVLADEQAETGVCERCQTQVERRKMSSWFFKITKYADRLLKNIEKIDWPEKIKIAQRQWIGKKDGINITYSLKGKKETITCFTTRPDTNFGATFIVVAPEYAQSHLLKLLSAEDKKTVSKYIKTALSKTEQQRQEEGREKTGVFTGLKAINQLNDTSMPIYVSDFVLMSVGTGAVVGVPGHDKRDFEFAQKFDLPVIRVVVAADGDRSKITRLEQVQEEEGTMVNSEFLNGLNTHQATQKMMDYLEKKGWGKRVTAYHLRDWLISRQRYWGPPIPMINCSKCGWQPVPEKDLPVLLPDIQDFKPKGDGTSPLSNAPASWKTVKCPQCGQKAQRELDVSDTFLDSSWYFLRYPSVKNKKVAFDPNLTRKWLPVDAYIGGAEHAVLHLLYSRFVTMVLHDLGLLNFEEPFPFLFGHGLLIKDGAKISKSRGNLVIPDDYIQKYGADTLRLYLMFLGPFDQGGDFRDTGIEGMYRFLKRVWGLFSQNSKSKSKTSEDLKYKMHQTIKKVTEDMEKFRYNTAIAAIMEYVNALRQAESLSQESLIVLAQLLAPFAPHITEDFWQKLGKKYSIHTSFWPKFDSDLAKKKQIVIAVQVNGKLRATFRVKDDQSKDKDLLIKKAKENKKISKWLKDKKIKKEIFVPGKLVNFVTN